MVMSGLRVHAAIFSVAENARSNSRRGAPAANSVRTIRSGDTEGSPALIFATRDWLELRRCAKSKVPSSNCALHFAAGGSNPFALMARTTAGSPRYFSSVRAASGDFAFAPTPAAI